MSNDVSPRKPIFPHTHFQSRKTHIGDLVVAKRLFLKLFLFLRKKITCVGKRVGIARFFGFEIEMEPETTDRESFRDRKRIKK